VGNILGRAVEKKVVKVSWVLDPETLAKLKRCPECGENAAVFLTARRFLAAGYAGKS
jgi:hypothetical protein